MLDRGRGNRVCHLICTTACLHDLEQITREFWISVSQLRVTGLDGMIGGVYSFTHSFPSSFHKEFEMACKMHKTQNKYLRESIGKENKKGRIDKESWFA